MLHWILTLRLIRDFEVVTLTLFFSFKLTLYHLCTAKCHQNIETSIDSGQPYHYTDNASSRLVDKSETNALDIY